MRKALKEYKLISLAPNYDIEDMDIYSSISRRIRCSFTRRISTSI